MAGAEGALAVMETWKEAFASDCPHMDIILENGDYPSGAARVCDVHMLYPPVDIGGMSGPFFDPQASTTDGWNYNCKFGSQRKAILVRKPAD